ncbi:MAG: glycosyltransferase family 2 protein [Patescibacteria group bacterium]
MPKVFISTISFNNNKVTNDLLKSIGELKTDNVGIFVVVVDNGSKSNYKADKKYNKFTLKIIRSEKNLGFSGGQNLGIRYALDNGADYVLILNNDTLLDKNLILALIDSLNENVGIVAPKIYFAKGYEFHKDKYSEKEMGKIIWYAGGIMDWPNIIARHRGVDKVDKGQYEILEQTDFASGCCMLVKREVFEKIGLFDEKYFLYYEDNDFSQRAKIAGFDIGYQSNAVMWHKNAASAGGSGSELQDYYITRNRLIFGFKYASLRSKTALFKESMRLIASGRKWQKKGVIDFYLRKFGKGSFSI